MKKSSLKNTFCIILSIFMILSCQTCIFASAEDASPDPDKISVDLINKGDGYSAVLYDSSSGLPTSEANAIAETADGFIWIGSYGGLIKYDGTTFERIRPAPGIASIAALFTDSKDRLWIGTNDSGVALMGKGYTRVYNKDDGLRSLYVRSVAEGADGTIYIATAQGIAMIGDDLELRLIDEPQINNEYVRGLSTGSDGIIYGYTTNGNMFTMKDGKLLGYFDGERLGIRGIHCFVPDFRNPGKVYIGTTGSEIYYGDLSKSHSGIKRIGIDPLKYVNDICQHGDQIWVCADTGIGLLEDGVFTALQDLPMHSSVEHMMTDYQGNPWFVSSKQGVMKIVPNRFEDLFYKYGIDSNVVNTTCVYNDMLFIGRKTAGLAIIGENGLLNSYPLKRAISASGKIINVSDLIGLTRGSQIRSIICSSNNELLISMYGKYPLIRLKDGSAECYSKEDGIPSERARTVCERKDGSLMAVCTGGLAIIKDGKVTEVFDESSGINNTEILTAAEADNGDMVLGTDGSGIYVISGHKVTHFGTDSGLSSEVVLRIKKDISRKLFWIVTSNSISFMDENYNITTVDNFPYTNNFDLYENSFGEMWVLSSGGIYVTSVEEMMKNDNITALLYDKHNGLPFVATANSYSELTENGDLYMAGSSGVVKVNIEKPFKDLEHVKMSVPYIEADGQLLFPDDSGSFSIQSGTKKLTVHEFAFVYSLTDPQISYCLEGFDSEYTSQRRSALAPIDYTNLSGGNYYFKMQLTDSRGNIKNQISVLIKKEKAIYEQTWFIALCVLFALILIGAIVLFVVHRKTQKLLKKDKEQRELIKNITEVLAKTIDMKDNYTNGHSMRVAKYTAMLAKELGYDEETVERYYNIALLHDIGKISVPAEVLNKNGKLSDEEFKIIRSHPQLGGETLRGIKIMPELAIGAESHHERPDGRGYPNGLEGDEIPRVAQIIAVADTFDAMYSDRPYRKRMNFEKVVSIMKEVSGTQLTADVVEAFLRLVEKGLMKAEDDNGGGSTEDIVNIHKRQESESAGSAEGEKKE
ncbi:MAG: HD domain-containing protein [Clostridia bacterium]|nr:HD domain-containing protein [Clostridia bacterium]